MGAEVLLAFRRTSVWNRAHSAVTRIQMILDVSLAFFTVRKWRESVGKKVIK